MKKNKDTLRFFKPAFIVNAITAGILILVQIISLIISGSSSHDMLSPEFGIFVVLIYLFPLYAGLSIFDMIYFPYVLLKKELTGMQKIQSYGIIVYATLLLCLFIYTLSIDLAAVLTAAQ